jgi:hypothetical protein
VEVGVTDAAEKDFNPNVEFSRIAPHDHAGGQRRSRTHSGISFGVVHGLNVQARQACRYSEGAILYAERAKSFLAVALTISSSKFQVSDSATKRW